MNAVPREVEEKGLKAYEEARAFESIRGRLVAIYIGMALIMLVNGVIGWKVGSAWGMYFSLAAAAITAACGGWAFQRQSCRYAENLRKLAEMDREYGDALPWIKIEKHFEALNQLREELAAEREKKTS